MRKLLLAATAVVCLSAPARASDCVNPKAKHCMCMPSGDPRRALGYGPVDSNRQSVRVSWTCTDMDTMEVTYHDGRAFIASDPRVNVKMVSPGGGAYSSDFTPPQ